MLTAAPAMAVALPAYPDQLPNAPDGCATCHLSVAGGGIRNDFGQDVERLRSATGVDWSALVTLDSDRDGFTNGRELGDPEGRWAIGDPAPVPALGEQLSNPGRASSLPVDPNANDGTASPMGGGCRSTNTSASWFGLVLVVFTALSLRRDSIQDFDGRGLQPDGARRSCRHMNTRQPSR